MKRLLGLVLALTFGAAATAVAQTPAPGDARGTLRYVFTSEPLTLNPILITNTDEENIAALYSDLLVVTDEHGKIVPQLAARVPTVENGDISKDGGRSRTGCGTT